MKGIEINSYAAELARVSIWIGEIQWMRNNGFGHPRDPILAPLKTIECRDAILNEDDTEPEWPDADVVIGNPPFLGGKILRRELGDSYVDLLQRIYGERIHGEADLVCHWFDKAWRSLNEGRFVRVGFVATNSIRGGRNRSVLDRVVKQGTIYDAWADEEWVLDGANVRVSLVCFADKNVNFSNRLDGNVVPRINADLTSRSVDLTTAMQLSRNAGIAYMGVTKAGSFEVSEDLARKWLGLPSNPNGRPNLDVLRPWRNGEDIANRSKGNWIIDFGSSMGEAEAAFYEEPFTHLEKSVKPVRQESNDEQDRTWWWRHTRPRPQMRKAISSQTRYIATPRVAKYRTFVWFNVSICPDSALIVIARDDDTTFGILHSRFHEAWSLRLGTSLGATPRYTPTTTFQTFPFPSGLSPDIPAVDYATDPRAVNIASTSCQLVKRRNHWLNPPDLVEWVEEPMSGFPKRLVPRDNDAAEELKSRTLTNLYNDSPEWLNKLHAALDAEVAKAYGWPADISTEDALSELLRMNLERSSEQ